MRRWLGPLLGLVLFATVGGLVLRLTSGLAESPAMSVRATETPTLTPVPTFTAVATPSPVPVALVVATPTETATATDTPPPAPTNTAVPPTATTTRRPPTATFTPSPPTDTPTPGVDFKVVEQRLYSLKENAGCSGNHSYFITVIDKNGVPLPNILVRRVFDGKSEIPPTGAKGPGRTEEIAPKYGGDMLFVLGDTSGARFTSERTHNLSTSEIDIPISDLIAAGYCPNDAAVCAQRVRDNLLCLGHHSYGVVFQRQW